MKLKEYFPSAIQSWRLNRIGANKLRAGKEQLPLVVSVKSFKPRIHLVHLAIKSVWAQSVLPQHTVLVLHESHQHSLPKTLIDLEQEGLEILYSPSDRSHYKLLRTLQVYPELPIVTFDDDVLYQNNWLNILFSEHLNYPQDIIALQSRLIIKDSNNVWLPYKQWPTVFNNSNNPTNQLAIGGAGVLYPPRFFHPELHNDALIESLCPKADDLWFKVMALLQHISIRIPANLPKAALPIIGSQGVSLGADNIKKDLNRTQWIRLCDYFNLDL
jgi:hypothetical protein